MKLSCLVLADNHSQTLGGIRRLLEGVAETVLMVTDEKSLCHVLENFKPEIVVADLSLPVSTERNVARVLKRRFPGMKVIILSAYDEMSVMTDIMAGDVDGFVFKPRAVIDLIPAINEIMLGHKYVSLDLKEGA
jgi:DNA-binding NarL/FixJ family response regulator